MKRLNQIKGNSPTAKISEIFQRNHVFQRSFVVFKPHLLGYYLPEQAQSAMLT